MSRPCFRNSALLALALLLVGASAPAKKQAAEKREPVFVTADRMEADKLGDRITFLGDVTLKKEDITLNADTLVVIYDASTKGIKEMEAIGTVVFRREGRIALSDRALYFSREEKIVLTGDPRIIEGENQLGGERITLFVRDDRSIVEGGKVLFYQDKAGEGKERKERKEIGQRKGK